MIPFLIYYFFVSSLFLLGLSLSEMQGETANDIIEKLENALDRVKVSQRQILTLAKDGASNEKAAANHDRFCEHSFHVRGVCHRVNLAVGDAMKGYCRAREGREEVYDDIGGMLDFLLKRKVVQPEDLIQLGLLDEYLFFFVICLVLLLFSYFTFFFCNEK